MPTSGPTPILADSRLTLSYQSNGLPHKLRMRCNRTTEVSGDWYLAQASGSAIKAQDAADMVFTLLAPLYKLTQASFAGWLLDKYDSGAYFPIDSGATAIVPSDTNNTQGAQQATMTFIDDNFKKVRFIILENRLTPANKYTYADLGGAYLDLANSIIDESDSGVGSWFCGRGDAPVNTLTFQSLVTSYNRKLRRKRGIA